MCYNRKRGYDVMKMKKILALGMAMTMALSLSACGGSSSAAKSEAPASSAASAVESEAPASSAAESSAASSAAAAADGQTYTVGICQLVQHPALDAATKGFKDALTEKLGDSVTFDEQNAAGDSATITVQRPQNGEYVSIELNLTLGRRPADKK